MTVCCLVCLTTICQYLANEICNFLYLYLFCLHDFLTLVQIHPGNLSHDFGCYTFCHGNHIIPVLPPVPTPSPLPLPSCPHPRPLSVVWLAWIKVPMMHGATTSTVSSASTPVTNVPFAESAASNQVCCFFQLYSVLTAFSVCVLVYLFSSSERNILVVSHVLCSHLICSLSPQNKSKPVFERTWTRLTQSTWLSK